MEHYHHHRMFAWTVLSIPLFKSCFLNQSSDLNDEKCVFQSMGISKNLYFPDMGAGNILTC